MEFFLLISLFFYSTFTTKIGFDHFYSIVCSSTLDEIENLTFDSETFLDDFYRISCICKRIRQSPYDSHIRRFNLIAQKYFNFLSDLYGFDPENFLSKLRYANPCLIGLFYRNLYDSTLYFNRIVESFDGRKAKSAKSLVRYLLNCIDKTVIENFKIPTESKEEKRKGKRLAILHFEILLRVKEYCDPVHLVRFMHPDVKVRPMRFIIDKLNFLIRNFKLDGNKIDPFEFEFLFRRVQSLAKKLNGKYKFEEVEKWFSLFAIYAHLFVITPNDKDIFISMDPKMLCLIAICYNQKFETVFGYHTQKIGEAFMAFNFPTSNVITMALDAFPPAFHPDVELPPRAFSRKPFNTSRLAYPNKDTEEQIGKLKWLAEIYSRLLFLDAFAKKTSLAHL
jgi:hypothetical protein